jgi:hypothetical protein
VSALIELFRVLAERRVRYVVIGVWGVNLYAAQATELFATRDTDLFVPPDPQGLLHIWHACDELGLELSSSGEPLDRPRDEFLARAVVERRALTRAADAADLVVDFTLVMAGFDFESVWRERRTLTLDGVPVTVARLSQIVESKRSADRPKDRLFLATYREILDDLQHRKRRPDEPPAPEPRP